MQKTHPFLLAILFILLSFGCENYIGSDINRDPNNPTSVPIFAQMPAIQIALADVYGGDFSRFNCMLTQQIEGVIRQYSSLNQYTGLTPNRYDDAWQNIYENILNEIKLAKSSALEDGNHHYLGTLFVIEAYTLMLATDVWDDMPYSEALKGVETINPPYDSQSDIYQVIYSLLDEAIALFGGAPGPLLPGDEDVYYGGNIVAWEKAAHAIKARGLLKDKEYASAAAEAGKAFASPEDNMGFQYPDANAAGQWYRFNRDRTGDMEFHPQMRTLMSALGDMDRLNIIDQPFVTSHPYMVADFYQELITYREMQFIIAEADLRVTTGGTEAGYGAYLAGIKASFENFALDMEAYNAYVAQAAVAPGVGNLTLEMVLTQKYIAMYLQPEVYSDWRRTGIPALAPTSGSAVPVRWHYSSDEYLFNSSAPLESDVNIFMDKVGWNR